MKIELRPSQAAEFPIREPEATGKQRELVVNPEGGLFDIRTLSAALRRAAPDDIIILPPGEYPTLALTKSVTIRSLVPGAAIITGATTIRAEHVAFSGISFRGETARPAIQITSGDCLLDDCTIHGTVTAGSESDRTRVLARHCLFGHADEGIVLRHRALADLHACRITRCRFGMVLGEGTTGALYHSRIESCVSTDENNPGSGVNADRATVYCEGTTFASNGIGVYLRDSPDAKFLFCHFSANETSALVALGESSSALVLRSCRVDSQQSSQCAQVAIDGPSAAVAHSVVRNARTVALSASGSRLEFHGVHLAASGEPALTASNCHLSGEQLTCTSDTAAGLSATGCQGTLRETRVAGHPPTTLTDCPRLVLETAAADDPASAAAPDTAPAATSFDEILRHMHEAIAQQPVRNQLERILRLAHAGQQRQLKGLPPTEQNFHSVFMGPPGTGKRDAAQAMAEGLFALGVISHPRVIVLNPESNGSHEGNDVRGGLVFVHASDATDSTGATAKLIEKHVHQPGEVVVIEGDRNELRRALRASDTLGRIFRNTLFFSAYGPAELCTRFVRYCERDHIKLKPETAVTLLLAFHLYCDRKDKLFANTAGVEVLYDGARRRYLERCSRLNRVDLEMVPEDFEFPQDRLLRAVTERSAPFVSFCPACGKENAWLAGLGTHYDCAHCDTPYRATWGVWKDSGVYRRAVATQEDSTGATHPLDRIDSLPNRR